MVYICFCFQIVRVLPNLRNLKYNLTKPLIELIEYFLVFFISLHHSHDKLPNHKLYHIFMKLQFWSTNINLTPKSYRYIYVLWRSVQHSCMTKHQLLLYIKNVFTFEMILIHHVFIENTQKDGIRMIHKSYSKVNHINR